jgi:hypothetical protein
MDAYLVTRKEGRKRIQSSDFLLCFAREKDWNGIQGSVKHWK